MKLSLQFMAKKLMFSYDVEVLNGQSNPKFGTARLFVSAISTSTKYNPIVIIPPHVSAQDIPPEFEGIIWLGPDAPDCPHPTIWIKDSVDALIILDRVQNIFDMHHNWCDVVREELLAQKTFADIVPLLSHVTINPFYYADAGFRTLAIKDDDTLYASSSSWRMQLEVGRHPVEILSRFVTSGELDTVNKRHEAWLFDSTTFHVPFVSRTVFCQGDVFGHLFIIETYPDQEVFDIEILEEFGNMLEAHLNLSAMSYSSTGRPYEPMLISHVRGTAKNSVETDYLLKLLSWQRDDQYRVAVFARGDGRSEDMFEGVGKAEIQAVEDNLTSSKAFLLDGKLTCVMNEARPEAISSEELIEHLCRRFHWKAGISNAGHSFDSINALFKRANAALDAGTEEDEDGILYAFEDYRLSIVFSALLEHSDADFLIHDDLRALIACDEENNTEFVNTLKAYLETERNSSRTADLMYLHRNSIAYRLDKMRSLMTSDLDDPDNRLFLMLSLQYWLHSQKHSRA